METENFSTGRIVLQLLGTGTIRTEQNVACAASLITTGESKILVDCGPGCFIRLKEAGIPIRKINCIFITHFHPDHVSDLISLLFAYFHTGTSENSLEIFGPVGLKTFWKNQIKTYGQWVNSPIFSFQELTKNSLDMSNFSMSWKKVSHNEESIGYRFEFGDKIISFSGDSGYCPELIELTKNANIAVLECAYPDSQTDPFHLNPSAISKIANLSGAKKIILTHLYPEVFPENPVKIIRKIYQGRVVIGNDLDQFVI